MKNFILILITLFNINACFAADDLCISLGNDYLITSESKIKTTTVSNPDLMSINPFYTIFNEKNMLLVHPEKMGKTKLTLLLESGEVVFDLSIRPKNTPSTFTYIEKNGVEFTLFDKPPIIDNFEIKVPSIDTGDK